MHPKTELLEKKASVTGTVSWPESGGGWSEAGITYKVSPDPVASSILSLQKKWRLKVSFQGSLPLGVTPVSQSSSLELNHGSH